MNEIIALQKYENEAQLAKELRPRRILLPGQTKGICFILS